ncbi:aspartate/glutamate racemase family protein [Colwelliaceae bacterium 6441]
MSLRIGVMHTLPAVEGTDQAEAAKFMNSLIRKNMDMVKSEGTEVTFQFPRLGLDGFGAFQYAYMNTLNEMQTLYGYMEMDQSGDFDALIGWCFYDPAAREGRQAVSLPIVFPAECCMKFASMMAPKFGVVTTNVKTQWVVDDLAKKYNAGDQYVGSIGIPCCFEDQIKAQTDIQPTIDAFTIAARELIAKGAEVIIPGCMLADTCLRLAPGCEEQYPNGVTDIDGVPILNVTAVTLKMAEMMATFNKTQTPYISKSLYYKSAHDDPESEKEAARIMKYTGPGFWRD